MVGCTDDWMHGWVNVYVDCLLVVVWAYGRLIHARGPLPIGLRALRHAEGPAGQLLTNNQRTQSPTMRPIIHPPNHPSAHSPTHPFTHPSAHSPKHPPTYPSTHIPIPPTTHPFLHSSIHLSIHTLIHSFMHPSMCMHG